MCISEKLWHICRVLYTLSGTCSVTIQNTMPLLLAAMSTAVPIFAWNSFATRRPLAKEVLEYGHVPVPTHVHLDKQPVSCAATVLLLLVVWLRLTWPWCRRYAFGQSRQWFLCRFGHTEAQHMSLGCTWSRRWSLMGLLTGLRILRWLHWRTSRCQMLSSSLCQQMTRQCRNPWRHGTWGVHVPSRHPVLSQCHEQGCISSVCLCQMQPKVQCSQEAQHLTLPGLGRRCQQFATWFCDTPCLLHRLHEGTFVCRPPRAYMALGMRRPGELWCRAHSGHMLSTLPSPPIDSPQPIRECERTSKFK